MTMIAAYCLILNTFVMRYAIGDQLSLVVSAGQSKWKEAFDSCNDPTYWHQLSNYCQPDSCNASNFTDTIINKPKFGRQEYWIYGYVLQSPVIGNIGCFSLNTSLNSTFFSGIFSFGNNSATQCSRTCPDTTKYMFIGGTECLCIPESHVYQQDRYSEENTGACKDTCNGNSKDLCGSATSSEGKNLYSVYKIVSRRTFLGRLGDTCAMTYSDGNYRFYYKTCTDEQNYICQRYNKSERNYPETCHNETVSWYAAHESCQEQGLQLRLFTSYLPACLQGQNFWSGDHIGEQIVWANDDLPIDALCLKLVITVSDSSFETEKCSSTLDSLCYKQQHMSSDRNDEAYTSKSTQSYSSTDISTDTRQPTAAVDRSTENYPIYITAVSTVFVLGVIIATIAFCIKRRFRQKLYTSVVPAQPQIYSDLNTNPYDEITELDMPQNLDEDGYEMPRSAKITTLG